MTLRYKICLFTITRFEDHSIKLDRAELLSLSIDIEIRCRAILMSSCLLHILFSGGGQGTSNLRFISPTSPRLAAASLHLAPTFLSLEHFSLQVTSSYYISFQCQQEHQSFKTVGLFVCSLENLPVCFGVLQPSQRPSRQHCSQVK